MFGLEVWIAYCDLGEKEAGDTILLMHGMSAWSYLNRRMIPSLVSAGHRVILFDQVGCGRSDKPSREQDYTYERHIDWNIDLLINYLRLKKVTVKVSPGFYSWKTFAFRTGPNDAIWME